MNPAQLLILSPKAQASIVCSDFDGRLCFYYSRHQGRGEQKTDQILIAHSKPVSAMDCSDEYLVTADEGNMLIIWTLTSHIPISNMLLPTNINSRQSTWTHIELTRDAGSKRPSEYQGMEDKPYPVEVAAYKQQNNLFMVLQSHGVLHIVRTTDNTLLQTFKDNVGNFAHFAIDYFDTSLLTVDEKYIVRVFSVVAETVNEQISMEEPKTPPPLKHRAASINRSPLKKRQTQEEIPQTVDKEKDSNSLDFFGSDRRTRFTKSPDVILQTPSSRNTQASPQSQPPSQSQPAGVLRRRGLYAAAAAVKLFKINPNDNNNISSKWSLRLMNEFNLRHLPDMNVRHIFFV